MGSIEEYFQEDVIPVIKKEIEKAFGNEVLFFGWTGEGNLVKRVQVIARGTEECVAVPIERSFLPDVIIHNHPDGCMTPSPQDMRIASVVSQRGVGFLIIDNGATEAYAAVEPVLKTGLTQLDAEKLSGLLSAGGPLSRYLPNYEERDEQKQMIRHVCDAFNQNAVAVIEAGTGIGKSVAYLIPAVEWSIGNRERVVISTSTINLQEQLLHKDIPGLRKALGREFSFVLMKGRGNYICLNKVSEISGDLFSFLDAEELEQFNAIAAWAEKTDEGSLSDLTFVPKQELWEKLSSSSETCLGGACRYFGRCFLNRVKRKALTAGIIVTNHHYLLADASLLDAGMSILPSYERVILDEAHNLENSATSFFTRSAAPSAVLRLLSRLYSEKKRGRGASARGALERGYLVHLVRKGLLTQGLLWERLKGEIRSLKSLTEELFESVEAFFAAASEGGKADSAVVNGAGTAEETAPGSQKLFDDFPVIEITEEVKNHPLWENPFCSSIGAFYKGLSRLTAGLQELKEVIILKGDEGAQRQLEGFCTHLTELMQTLDIFLRDEEKLYVRWIEKRREPRIVSALVDVGGMLDDLVFKRAKSAVLTSATLSVGGSFNFIKGRLSHGALSLDDRSIEVQLRSPFDYDSQMAVLLPADIVEPEHPSYQELIGGWILEVLLKTRGKAFVLFTSHRALNEVYGKTRDHLAEAGLTIFKQGSDSRRNLLRNFKADIHSILFGTESFWEGVDAPGETLECVIIARLPFKAPTEPITRARLKQIEERGGNSFIEYTLPMAVIKMKQGMGRLIRNKMDRGIIVILDKRIQTKRYGRVFLNSMPGGTILKGELSQILNEAQVFLTNRSSAGYL